MDSDKRDVSGVGKSLPTTQYQKDRNKLQLSLLGNQILCCDLSLNPLAEYTGHPGALRHSKEFWEN